MTSITCTSCHFPESVSYRAIGRSILSLFIIYSCSYIIIIMKNTKIADNLHSLFSYLFKFFRYKHTTVTAKIIIIMTGTSTPPEDAVSQTNKIEIHTEIILKLQEVCYGIPLLT